MIYRLNTTKNIIPYAINTFLGALALFGFYAHANAGDLEKDISTIHAEKFVGLIEKCTETENPDGIINTSKEKWFLDKTLEGESYCFEALEYGKKNPDLFTIDPKKLESLGIYDPIQ